jgi:hypothetical protein
MSSQTGRRASPRVAASIPVEYAQAGQARAKGRIVELAAGGCILEKTMLQPNGSDVALLVRIDPDNPGTQVQGSVVRAKEGVGTALEFVSASPEARAVIMEYVEGQIEESAACEDRPADSTGSESAS